MRELSWMMLVVAALCLLIDTSAAAADGQVTSDDPPKTVTADEADSPQPPKDDNATQTNETTSNEKTAKEGWMKVLRKEFMSVDLGTVDDFWINFECYLSRYPSAPARPLWDDAMWVYLRGLYTSIVGPWASMHLLEDGFAVPVYLGYHPRMGRGVFAAQDIAKGTKIWDEQYSAEFTEAWQMRTFLLSVPQDLACDLLQWCYGMKAEGSSPHGGVVYCDLDMGSFLNTGSSVDDVNLVELPQSNATVSDVTATTNGKLTKTRMEELGKHATYAKRDIKAGEQLLTNYAEFDFDHAWRLIGM